ncbi:FtsX-like permease family protein [Marispirochaeta sp.]|uniref:ABC transporter permease n=1 Tax=Marispirochaeta sp. TaxID=2038653 RepID=UPI0029C61753|nr:FtsX-like permease family protein [Marispirochaeta sp.]
MKLSAIAFRNISRNRRRSLLCILAIALAAMAIVFLFSLLAGMKADLEWNVQSFFTGQVRVRHNEFDEKEMLNPLHLRLENWPGMVREIESLDSPAQAVPRIPFPAFLEPPTVRNPDAVNAPAMGVGLLFEKEAEFQQIERYLAEGSLPRKGESEVLLGAALAKKISKKVGDTVTLITTTMRRGPNAATFTISGIAAFNVAAMNQSYFYIPLDRAQSILKMGDSVVEILVKFEKELSDKEAKALVAKTLAPEDQAVARDWRELNLMVRWIDVADISYNFMALIFFILAGTVIANSVMMIIYERMREIGTIGALGMEGREIVRLFFLEAFFMSLIGTAIGVACGIGITAWLGAIGLDFSSGMQGVDFDISSIIYPRLNLKSTLFVFFYSLTVASVSSLIPTHRAAKIEPVEALRHV